MEGFLDTSRKFSGNMDALWLGADCSVHYSRQLLGDVDVLQKDMVG